MESSQVQEEWLVHIDPTLFKGNLHCPLFDMSLSDRNAKALEYTALRPSRTIDYCVAFPGVIGSLSATPPKSTAEIRISKLEAGSDS